MKILIFFLLVVILFTSCSKKEPSGPDITVEKAILLFPEQNAICISGANISGTQSSITFKWVEVTNANSYTIMVKNLQTNEVITQISTQNEAVVTLLKNTPYSWSVNAKTANNKTSSQSVSWKFYNAGTGTISYPPFPADELVPADGQSINAVNGKIKIMWKGSDADQNIVNYDIYLGTTALPGIYKKEVLSNSLEEVQVNPKTRYYWKIVSRDAEGNTSESNIVSFSTN